MKLKEIINRPVGTPIEHDEACFVIGEYIKEQTGIKINPRINRNNGTFNAIREVELMNKMFNYAIDWFRKNK